VIFLDDLQWCSQSEFMLIANIAEEANRKLREWDYNGGAVSPTETNGTITPRNGMRQSMCPLDRGRQFRSSCLVYLPATFPGRF
jgi:hypothetical protein